MLGPLGSHPAGQLLTRLHRNLEAGNIATVATLFTDDARHGRYRGRSEIAAFYRELLDDSSARRVDLRVLRMDRDGDAWDIEADFEIEVYLDGRTRTVQSGRTQLRLDARADRLAISRLEP